MIVPLPPNMGTHVYREHPHTWALLQLPGQGKGIAGFQACLDLDFAWGMSSAGSSLQRWVGWEKGLLFHPSLHSFIRTPGVWAQSALYCRISQNPPESSEGPGSVGGAQITNSKSRG